MVLGESIFSFFNYIRAISLQDLDIFSKLILGEFMRINKFLASCGLGSRRKVEDFVINGKVNINGRVVTDLTYDVCDDDLVICNGKSVSVCTNKVYLMLNKPKCYITSLKDEKGRHIVIDLLKGCKEKVFPVGRLDYNTEGLLLLTNDGDWANKIIHPSNHIEKTYEVKVKYQLTNKQLNEIRRGILIDGVLTLPAKIGLINCVDNYYIYHITIIEGKNREIRKMFQYLNLKIYSLKRLSIGRLTLGNLEVGKYRYLQSEEINKVFM